MGETGATEGVADQQTVGSAWRLPGPVLGAIACGTLAIIGLAALAGAVDLSSLNRGPDQAIQNGQPAQGSASGGSATGSGSESVTGTSEGLGPVNRITVNQGNGEVRIEPIPGCPGGIAINDEVLIVPDPEACGFRPIEPGEQVEDDDGRILLVPDQQGTIGGVQIGDDGQVQLVPIEELDQDAVRVDRGPDGTITIEGVEGAEGEPIEIDVTDEGGFVVRNPDGSIVETEDGQLTLGTETSPGDSNPSATDDENLDDSPANDTTTGSGNDRPSRANDNRNDGFAGLALLLPILVLGALAAMVGLCLVLVKGIIGGLKRPQKAVQPDPATPTGPELALAAGPDYSNEIGAIDRLLREIDQEQDPRRAIQRVYAVVETGMGNDAMARRSAETPGVYLQRVLGRDQSLQPPLEALTSLFEQARFSQHEITPEMRNLAIASLQAIRAQFLSLSDQPASAAESEVLV